MKLHWSPRSPYVRKVMVAAHELGLADQIETVRTVVAMAAVSPAIQADNPLGKIPTLLLAARRSSTACPSSSIWIAWPAPCCAHPPGRSAGRC